MARPLNDSPYLYGLHDSGGEGVMTAQQTPGWVLFTEEIGADPNDQRSVDYSRWADQGLGLMVRLNHGYEPSGTIPNSSRYPEFARRCANFVRNSRGCHIWIIGNEMNFAVERPGVQIDHGKNPPVIVRTGETITPTLYANCYRLCRAAIRAVPGRAGDLVVTGAVAPWNSQTAYDGNPTGDWARYQADMLRSIGVGNCDAISIHAYTHGADPALVHATTTMNAPFTHRQYHFRAYQDFMWAIPKEMRSLPVYLTEIDQNDEWRNENNGWIQRAFGEIDWWNRHKNAQRIRAVILYRWKKGLDKWGIEGKAGVVEDFKIAMTNRYNWETVRQTEPELVEPVDPADETIDFPETGRTAKGPFAAFHRKYGAEVTGAPLVDSYIHPETGLRTQEWQRVVMEEHKAGSVRLRSAGQELLELKQAIAALERRLSWLEAGGVGPQPPQITDITYQLPRDPARFVRRPDGGVSYVVINHTAVRSDVGADRVAEAQLARWPGIISQFFVTGAGEIQQTNPVDQVVAADQAWIFRGINIYVAGNFDEAAPSAAQIAALARLCGWLLATYKLGENALRGASEFIETHSPGLQWLTGLKWRELLLAEVRKLNTATPGEPAPGDSPLAARVASLEAELQRLNAELKAAEERNAVLQARIAELTQGGNTGDAKVVQPAMTDIAAQLPRNPGSLKVRARDQIRHLVFNHTAVDPSVGVERVAAAHQKRWGAILHQFFISADGTILLTNALDQVVDLSQAWIAQGINIAVAGDFTAEIPNEAQLRSAAHLCAWLIDELGMAPESVKGACDFIKTQSPGLQWNDGQKWRELLIAGIADFRAAAPALPSGDGVALAALRVRVGQLEGALAQAQTQLAAVTAERDHLAVLVAQPGPEVEKLQQTIGELTNQIKTLGADKAALAAVAEGLRAENASLNQRVTALTAQVTEAGKQLAAAAQEKSALNLRISNLESEIQSLRKSLGDVFTVPAPAIVDLSDKLPVHEKERYETRTRDKITHIAIHHSAATASATPQSIAKYHVSKDWPGIGYHFYITPDGTIYQTNRLETISFQVFENNHYSVGICLAGTFNEALPTRKQITQAGHLVAWLMQELHIPADNVLGHKEFPDNSTACPGTNWLSSARWKGLLQARIRAVQSGSLETPIKPIDHYVLFWEKPDGWAQQDWLAAVNYVGKFRPTSGFSAEEAANANCVTIVGGEGGVSKQVETVLIASDCRVDRLAGVDYADTKRLLDELVKSGKPFRSFES